MVLVDDVVARPELGEGLQGAAGGGGAAASAAAEDLGVGQEREAEVAPDEAPPGRRDGEEELGLGGRSAPGSVSRASTRRSRFCVRSASPWCGNATTVRRPPRTNARSSFSASERPRAAIAGRCASKENGWPAGSWSSSTARPRSIGSSCSSLQTSRTSLGSQTKSGRRGAARRGRRGPQREPRSPRRRRAWLDQVEAALGGRVDRRESRGRSARWVNGEKARMPSISSPKSSMRAARGRWSGKMSMSPPRTANWPRSSARSTRS